jgi:protein-tyrosine kinase
MSRIEEALEKAVKMREMTKEVVSTQEPVGEEEAVSSKFPEGVQALDVGLVDEHVVTLANPFSHAAEQYKKLRARILRATSKNHHNTIMITSSDMREGKSLTAINLAVALSGEIDHTVLLVDSDLRNPSVHRYFGIEEPRGLSDYLKGEANLPELLIKTGIGRLVILPGGAPTDSSAELLSSERMKTLVQEIKARYKDRYIIFDTSPLLVIADALALASYVDDILFVIQEGRTAQEKVAHAISLLKGCSILGVVFNNAHQSISRDTQHYYYRYGSRAQQTGAAHGGSTKENKP